VDFGASPEAPPAQNLLQFWQLLHQPGPSSASLDIATDANPLQSQLIVDILDGKGPHPLTQDGAAFKFVLEGGNYPGPSAPTTGSQKAPSNEGSGAFWNVRAGSFQFRVMSDFAITSYNVAAGSDGDEPGSSKNSEPHTQSIGSKPMRLPIMVVDPKSGGPVPQPIVSDMTITVKERVNHTIHGAWQNVDFVVKAVPSAIWGFYDPANDPLNNPGSSLLQNKPGDSTRPLCMGVKLTAPPPVLAEATIGIVRPSLMAVFRVLDFGDSTKPQGTNWILQPTEPTQSSYLARSLTPAEQALIAQQSSGGLVKLWNGFQEEWSVLKTNEAIVTDPNDGIIARCTQLFGWSQKRPVDDPAGNLPTWQLSGAMPKDLIANINSAYMELPRLCDTV
jgi:hypothetical protein